MQPGLRSTSNHGKEVTRRAMETAGGLRRRPHQTRALWLHTVGLVVAALTLLQGQTAALDNGLGLLPPQVCARVFARACAPASARACVRDCVRHTCALRASCRRGAAGTPSTRTSTSLPFTR